MNSPAQRRNSRSCTRYVALLLPFWCFFCHAALATTSMESKLYLDSGKQSFEKCDLRAARTSFESAVQNARTGADKFGLVLALNWLAKTHFKENRIVAAETTWEQALAALAERQNKDSNILNQVQVDLAETKLKLGKFAEAERIFQELFKSEVVARRNPEVKAAAASGLVRLYQETGRARDASIALEQRKGLSSKNDEVFDAFNTLDIANLLVDVGNAAAAQPMFEAILTSKSASLTLSDRAEASLALARMSRDEGKLEEAEEQIKKILDELHKSAQTHCLQLASALITQSSVNLSGEKNKAAINSALQAVSILDKQFGAKSPLMVDALRQRAEVYCALDDYRSAERDYRSAIALEKEHFGETSVSLSRDYSSLAYLLLQQGKYQSAEDLYKQALALITRAYGADSSAVATALNNLALLYMNSGDQAKAEKLVRESLELRKKIFSEKSCAVARSMTILATMFADQSKQDAAEQMLRKAIDIQEELLKPCHPELIGTQRILADLYLTREKYSDAEPLLRKILANDKDTFGGDSASVAVDLEKLASVLSGLKRSPEQAEVIRELDAVRDKLREESGLALEQSSAQSSVSSEREVVLPGQVTPVKDKWALIIGITNFKDPSINLKYAAKDATDFRNFLVNEANFKADHVKLLTDEGATREKIVGNLGETWLRRLANPDDLVVIYVSTHGSPERKDIGGANFIVPYEGTLDNLVLTGIPMQWLTAGIQETVHCNRIVLVLDICHAGAAGGIASKGFLRTVNDQVLGTGQLVIASSKADQISWESGRYPNGVFTRKLIEALRTPQVSSQTIGSAFAQMRTKVEEEVLRDRAKLQTPIIYSKQWRGGDIKLSAPPLEPRPALPAPGNTTKSASPTRK